MKNEQMIKDIVAAIASVKTRAKKAYDEGDTVKYWILMGDLMALQTTLSWEMEEAFSVETKKVA